MSHSILPVRPRRARLAIAALATGLVGTIALAGCTSARDQTSSASSPAEGGTLTVATFADLQFDALTFQRNFSWAGAVFEPLATYDGTSLSPVLASDITVADDGLGATITLRDDVVFHNGDPLTAADVQFTFETLAETGSNAQVLAREFSAYSTDGDHTLTITFSRPLGTAFFDLINQSVIFNAATHEGLADGSEVVGTGPFQFSDWNPGAGFSVIKFDDYRNADDVHLDGIDFIVTTDATAQLNALRSGRADVGYGMTPLNASTLDADSGFDTLSGHLSFYHLGLNVDDPTLESKEVRQAISYAIDYDRINDQVFAGTGTPSNLPWPSGTPGVSDEQTLHYTYDPDLASKMIEEAGASGAEVTLSYNQTNPAVTSAYEIVANNLTAAGLSVQADGMDLPTYAANQQGATFEGGFINIGLVTSPATQLSVGVFFREEDPPTHFESTEFNTLRDAVLDAVNEEENAEAVAAMSDYMLDEAFFPILQLAPTLTVYSSSVTGLGVDPLGDLTFEDVYLNN